MKLKSCIAYRVGRCLIVKNYNAGRRNRFDTFKLGLTRARAVRVGCELTLKHSISIALKTK